MHTTSDLSFAPRLRPFYATDATGYGNYLSDLVVPGDLHFWTESPQRLNLHACKLLGGGVMTRLENERPMEVRHEKAHLAHADDDMLAMVALAGSGVVAQEGRRLEYRRGDITFRRADLPSTSTVLEASQLVVFRVSRERFFGPCRQEGTSFVPCLAASEHPMVELVATYLQRVFPQMPQLNPEAVLLLEQSLISLLAAIYFQAAPATSRVRTRDEDRWQAVAAYIDTNISDPDLTVERVCAGVHVSKRQLHRLFELRGVRYGQHLLARRLAKARADLQDEQLRGLTIAEIGFRSGFSDPSHFSRAFRLAYGSSPRVFRGLAAG